MRKTVWSVVFVALIVGLYATVALAVPYDPIVDFTTAKGTVETFVGAAAPLLLAFAGLVVAIMIGLKWIRKLQRAA